MIGIYVRVSTEDQNYDGQADKLEDWCKGKGLKFRVYGEKASGKSTKGREELEKCIRGVETGYLEGIVVWDITRFGRSLVDLIQLLNRVMVAKGRFVSVMNGFDIRAGDPTSMLTYQIFGAIAEFERKMISERTKIGMARAKREGKKIGGRVKNVDEVELIQDLMQGASWIEVMKKYGISRWKLAQIANRWKGEKEDEKFD